jgi:hypothetical protein
MAAVLAGRSTGFMVIRVSKLLVLPACLWFTAHPRFLAVLDSPVLYGMAAFMLALSQFFWAYYIIAFYT